MIGTSSITEKVKEIIQEMKTQKLWRNEIPGWVTDYEKKTISNQQDFAGWLQFAFLPNCLFEVKSEERGSAGNYIALQAKRFFSDDVQKGKLLQLLIELDSLS